MKTNVGTLVIVDMDGYFGAGLQWLAGGVFEALQVCRDDVVGLAGGHSLGKFAGVVGIELPADFFLLGPPDFDLDPVECMAIGIPNRSINQGVGLWLLLRRAALCASRGN